MRILDATRDELYELLEGKFVTLENTNADGQSVGAAGIVVDVVEQGVSNIPTFTIAFDWGWEVLLTPKTIVRIDEDLSNR